MRINRALVLRSRHFAMPQPEIKMNGQLHKHNIELDRNRTYKIISYVLTWVVRYGILEFMSRNVSTANEQ
jgi:hypothetical protein